DSRGEHPSDVLARRPETDPYAAELVRGVETERGDIDALIAERAPQWELGHMPVVDRNALRLGLYELQRGDVPAAVVMDEAVELCKRFSTEEAGRFVNGVLAAVALGGLGGHGRPQGD